MANWEELAPGLWRTTYTTGMGLESNSYAVRIGDGELAIVSPSCKADDAFFAATDALGKVVALVANNTGHDLGQAPWQARYPDAGTYSPEVAGPAVQKAKKVKAFQALSKLSAKSKVTFVDVPGTRSGLTLFSVDAGEQRALFVDEFLADQPVLKGPPPIRFALWATGSGPGLKINNFWRWIFAKDKVGVARAVLAEVDRFKPTILITAHGEPITGDKVAKARDMLAALVS